jgi:effector-binding domain-containing protein
MSGPPSVVYFLWDEDAGITDMMPAFPVHAAPDTNLPGLETHVVPEARMLQVMHQGDWEGLGQAHEAMDQMIKAHGLEHYGNVIETYIQGPPEVQDPADYVTRIHYMVR